jgi:hypothetical protein
MRLVVNATAYGDPPGGAGLRARLLFGALRGHEILFLLAEDTPQWLVPPGAEARRLPVRAGAPLRRWLGLRLPREGDLLFTDHYPALPGPPTVVTLHDTGGGALRRALVRRHLARAAAVVAVSETVARAWGVPALVVPNGVASPPDPLPSPGRHLLLVDPRKGAAAARRGARGFELREVGRGRAWLPQEELFREMAAAAAVLVPSRGEGFGMVALEAMALGRPVVVPDLPAFREVLGEHPFYASGGAWGAAIRAALACPAERLAAAREHARRYTWEAAAARVEELIRVLAAGRSPAYPATRT